MCRRRGRLCEGLQHNPQADSFSLYEIAGFAACRKHKVIQSIFCLTEAAGGCRLKPSMWARAEGGRVSTRFTLNARRPLRLLRIILATFLTAASAPIVVGDIAGARGHAKSPGSEALRLLTGTPDDTSAFGPSAAGDWSRYANHAFRSSALLGVEFVGWGLAGLDASRTVDSGACDAAGPTIQELPPAPDSATLALSGLMGVAAMCVVRSARHWHFAAVPHWYHSACPDQIGHATPAPAHLDRSLQPLCILDTPPPAPDSRLIMQSQPREILARLRSQFILPATAPRGPPTP